MFVASDSYVMRGLRESYRVARIAQLFARNAHNKAQLRGGDLVTRCIVLGEMPLFSGSFATKRQ